MLLREVKRAELETLRELSISTFVTAFGAYNDPSDMELYLSEKMSLEHITSEYDHPNSTFYFAIVDDEIVGYLKLNTGDAQNENHLGNSIEVERIYVIAAHQGKKIGEAIFKEAINLAKQQKKDILWLGVWDQNVRAITFYQRMGLEIFDSHDFMLGTDLQTDILMKMSL